MIAANIMSTGAVTLRRGADMLCVLKLISEKRAGQVYVVEEDGRLAGVITSVKLMEALLAPCPSGAMTGEGSSASGLPEFIGKIDSLADKSMDGVIDSGFISVKPDTKTMEVAAIFADGKKTVESIPVLDDQGRLLGIISPWDVFKRLWEYALKKNRQGSTHISPSA
ncbi:MAG: CBS domain-containing protein [Deltaproteobacteria bacterium]